MVVQLLHMPVAGFVYHFDPAGWLYPLRGIVCVVITMIVIRIIQWLAKHLNSKILFLFAIPEEYPNAQVPRMNGGKMEQ